MIDRSECAGWVFVRRWRLVNAGDSSSNSGTPYAHYVTFLRESVEHYRERDGLDVGLGFEGGDGLVDRAKELGATVDFEIEQNILRYANRDAAVGVDGQL